MIDRLKLNETENGEQEEKGIIYVGHLPYGFVESGLKEYFSQYGDVLNVKLGRSRKVFFSIRPQEAKDLHLLSSNTEKWPKLLAKLSMGTSCITNSWSAKWSTPSRFSTLKTPLTSINLSTGPASLDNNSTKYFCKLEKNPRTTPKTCPKIIRKGEGEKS